MIWILEDSWPSYSVQKDLRQHCGNVSKGIKTVFTFSKCRVERAINRKKQMIKLPNIYDSFL